MPVDDDILKSKMELIDAKRTQLINEITELNSLYANLYNIAKIKDPDDKTKKVLPNDGSLGIRITPDRRQKIFDNVISEITRLGL